MSKNSRKAIKKVPTLITEDKDCQTDELLNCLNDISISDNPTTSSSTTSIHDLTKEQLMTRLKCSQSLCNRIKAMFNKERQQRKEEQQNFINFFHEVKVALHESRHSYNLIKQDIADSGILFVNGREKLKNKMETYQKDCQIELASMRDKVARNDVVVEKANLTVAALKNEIEKTLKISDDTRKKIQKATTDKGFIETQYKALQKKQHEKYISAAECCPKCNATKTILNELTDNIKNLQSAVKRLENECQTVTAQKSTIEIELKTLQKTNNQVVHERNMYKESDRILREQLAKTKKALSDSTNSPNRTTKILEMLNSPARLEHSPNAMKETPPHLKVTPTTAAAAVVTPPHNKIATAGAICDHKSPTPLNNGKCSNNNIQEPPPKKRTNGISLSREEGEVSTPEDEQAETPPPPGVDVKPNDVSKSPPLQPQQQSRKRPLSPKSKPKQLDYVYIMNDRQKPPSETTKPEPRPLLKQEIRPPLGYESRHQLQQQQPRPRHQSPPFRFDSSNPSSYYHDEYPSHRPQPMPQQQRPSNPYHQQVVPPYHQQQRPLSNGYPASSYSPSSYPPPYHQQQHPSQQHPSHQHPLHHPMSTPGSYYRPAVNGGPPPWHIDNNRPPSASASQQYQQRQQPPGESWTGWR